MLTVILDPPHPLQPAVLTAMPDHPHSLKPAVLTAKPPLLTSLQPAVLFVMTDLAHSTPTGRDDRYAGPSSVPYKGHADRYAGQSSLRFIRPHWPLGPTPSGCPPTSRANNYSVPFQPAVLTVMSHHPHSFPSGRADRYAGPFSLPSNRPCWPLCLTIFTLCPYGRADSYAWPFLLPSNRLCAPL